MSIIYLFMSYFCFPGMKNREERSKHFFDSGPLMEEDEDLAVYEKVFSYLISHQFVSQYKFYHNGALHTHLYPFYNLCFVTCHVC